MTGIQLMTLGDIERQIDHLEGIFAYYAATGQGVSSKESVMLKDLKDERARRHAAEARRINERLSA